MTSEPLTFVVPMPPNISNGAHGHWMGRYRTKQAYQAKLDQITLLSGKLEMFNIPPLTHGAFSSATISSVMHLGAAMDDDNAMRRHKWVIDWLKTRGYIVDDRKKCLAWTGFPEQVVKRGQVYRIILTLTPV